MCGDIVLILAHKRNVSYEDFKSLNQDDQEFLRLCVKENLSSDATAIRSEFDSVFNLSAEHLLIRAVDCYQESLKLSPSNEEKDNIAQVNSAYCIKNLAA